MAFQAKYFDAGQIFTPGSPVNEKDLFAGRLVQIGKVLNAVSQRGYHAVLYGERGVGKTSLANILNTVLPQGGEWLVIRVNCDGTDTFSSMWRKALKEIVFTHRKQSAGFTGAVEQITTSFADNLPFEMAPDDVRRAIQSLPPALKLLFVFDEFDRLANKDITVLMADTIKTLSDYAMNASILLIGVADSVDELVVGHQSIERALVQIPMPRMSSGEIREIINNGMRRLEMTIAKAPSEEIVSISQGLPYITHLLALESARSAINNNRLEVNAIDVDTGIESALGKWQQTTTKAYYNATQSSQPGNIYKEVLLACALSETDEFGFFSASAVRTPLRLITVKDYDIPNFAQHLKNFSDEARGGILQRTGETRRIRYRFTSPLHRPYIVMRGFKDGLIDRKQMSKMTANPIDNLV